MNKKDAIRNAALKLLVEKGIHDTPMSQIAKSAGTGMGTIYNYFPNKEMLINDIYQVIKEEELEAFNTVDTSQPVKNQFENYITVLINFLVRNPSYFNFLEQMEASPIITEENLKKGNKTVEMVAALLKNGQEKGIVRGMEVDQLLVFIGGSVRASANWHLQSRNSGKNYMQAHIELVWDAIKG